MLPSHARLCVLFIRASPQPARPRVRCGSDALTAGAARLTTYLARRARGKGARDGTKYGESRTSARGFFNHHVERVGLAAQQYDAKAIRKSVRSLKQAQVSRATAGCAAGMA